MFLQAGLVETDQWGDLGELEARYSEAVALECPVSIDPNLAVLAEALNRRDAGEVADSGAQVFMAALVCGSALVPQVRELSETRAIFDDRSDSYLLDMAISWALDEKAAIPLRPNGSPVIAAAFAQPILSPSPGWLKGGSEPVWRQITGVLG
jgi:hypothetical protein